MQLAERYIVFLFLRHVGTHTDPTTGAVVDQYAIRKQFSQPVQHVQHVTQEQISYVQQLVPEVRFYFFGRLVFISLLGFFHRSRPFRFR